MPFSPLAMSSGAVESGAFGGGLDSNATRAEKVEQLLPPFSSTSALSLLGVVILAIVALSLTTHHCNKGKMKRRKIERAQEEYERDHCNPVPARDKPDLGRCIIVRPASSEPVHGPAYPGKQCASPYNPPTTLPTQTGDTKGTAKEVLEGVAVS